jgi:hypothetical protein
LFLAVLPAQFRADARDLAVFVTDGDLEEPLAGAVVRLPDGTEITADGSGRAVFSVPDEMRGEMTVTYSGYGTARVMLGGEEDRIDVVMRADVLENEELVVEGQMSASETALSGRGVSLGREEIERGSEIGLVEDVMSSIKLLPGVGYSGLFNAMPSIRGGEPWDLKAALDGFYVDSPYHWGGGYSIFDPKTIESARLYHGVFSARYSYTVSGLLELASKRAQSDRIDFGINVSTSAAGFNLSCPLPDFSDFNGPKRGGMMLIGKITYWDPFVAVAKEASRSVDILSPINAVSIAPYLRSLSLTANYRLSADSELFLSAYIGGDGVGAMHDSRDGNDGMDLFSDTSVRFNWDNTVSFITANALFAPAPYMMIKTTAGASYISRLMDSYLRYSVQHGNISTDEEIIENYEDIIAGAQFRTDFDMDLKNGFLFSAGVEELYRYWFETLETNAAQDAYNAEVETYRTYSHIYPDINNSGWFTGLYSLLEYRDPAGRFAAEAGLRLDHLYFIGDGFTVQTFPALNPRINFDYFPVRDRSGIDLITLTAGYGLFSAIGDSVPYIDKSYGVNDFDLKQTRSGTGIAGIKIDFLERWFFTLELYYKYLFDRAYTISVADGNNSVRRYCFDGEGHIWGFDLMLSRIDGRFVDGWITYSFNYAHYRDPKSIAAFSNALFRDRNDNWYFPEFHRFSNLNVVLNFKPSNRFNIYTRFGFASGLPQAEYGEKYPYTTVQADGSKITKYRRPSYYSDTNRSAFSLPLDIKFSWFFVNPGKKSHSEAYLAVENALSLFYRPEADSDLNPYTGNEEEATGGTPPV